MIVNGHLFLVLFIDFSNFAIAKKFRNVVLEIQLDSFRDLVSLFLRLANLEPRFKFQRALRPKKENEEARQIVTKRAATNGFSSFGFCFGSKEWEAIVITLSLCSF